MPTISVFFGIVIRMYYDDHGSPHFHAYYGDEMAAIDIKTLRVLSGNLSPRALTMVTEWAILHKESLERDWQLAVSREPLLKIEPLE